MAVTFLGVDGEMTGSEIQFGQRIFQLGIAAHTDSDGSVLETPATISLLFNPGEYVWTDVAEAVHGFTKDEVNAAMPASEADDIFVNWLTSRGLSSRKRGETIPVGFNIGSFDMPHIQLVLPKTYAFFSRRTVDLNSLCFTLEGKKVKGSPVSWSTWKSWASEYARKKIYADSTHAAAAHDAGYDALLHLHAWRFLQRVIHDGTILTVDVKMPPEPLKKALQVLLQEYGLDHVSRVTGVPEVFLKQWNAGGRATNEEYIKNILAEYENYLENTN